MQALWLALRIDLRRRWWPMIGLTLLLGVIGGVVLSAAAGAERPDPAYPRLLRQANAAQLLLMASPYTPAAFYARLRRLPQVASLSEAGLYNALLPARDGPGSTTVETFSTQIVPATKVNAEPMALFGPPFASTRLALSASFGAEAAVRLHSGVSLPAFLHAASGLARHYRDASPLGAINLAEEATATGRAIRAQAVALALFAVLGGLIALVVISQPLSRLGMLIAAGPRGGQGEAGSGLAGRMMSAGDGRP